MKCECDTCDKTIIPVEGVNCTRVGSYLYCANCALIRLINGTPEIAIFPCPGRLIPETILDET